MSQFNSPNSSHIFSDLEISDDDGDLNILRPRKRSCTKDRESCDRVKEKICTTNTKNIASSSHSCENDLFMDKNIHSESIKTHENGNSDPHTSLFDNEEDKCSASGWDFSKELLSPTLPDETYQGTRNNLKRKKKKRNLDDQKNVPSINMPLMSAQTSDQQSSVSSNIQSKVKLNDTKVNVQHPPSLRAEINDFNEDSTGSAQVAQSNAISTSVNFNLMVESRIITRDLMSRSTYHCSNCEKYHRVTHIRRERVVSRRSVLSFEGPLGS
ncbi:uncharacterized protein TNIN_64351 [Trichonephila inaurata madagascariensis]|uniref:Uncharacterized protein n=1 Tax=Trichonephila inaurata madagascariensis TaxID=2747483 RepID=A0A8X6WXC2_9ARAC|nr:uncharacterized protein TNIN_64351 [Trichonephila inaurata madagascariensis]